MIFHLLKMVWNRKRTNWLIVLEIFVSFLVLFSTVAMSLGLSFNYRSPLGFSYQNIWVVQADPGTYNYGPSILPEPALQEKYRQVLMAVRGFDQVQTMAAAYWVPYGNTEVQNIYQQGTRRVVYYKNEVSDAFKEVMNLRIVRGRWFEPEDDALNWQPVVVNEEFAQSVFGNEDPMGKPIPGALFKILPDGTNYVIDGRIIGVISGFRRDGEYSAPKPYAFCRRSLSKPASDMLRCIVVKIRPGTPRSFEGQLMKALKGVAKDWSFQIQSLEDMRESKRKLTVVPLQIAVLVAGFLMIMVGFGLLGVLWLNVTRRTTEFGLRRAQGATAADVYRQILGELFFIATMGLIPGILLVIQFPLLNLIGNLKTSVYFYSIVLSMVLIYLLSFICGLYPGWLATRIRPAEALHYE